VLFNGILNIKQP